MWWIISRYKRRIAQLEADCQQQSDRADKLQDLANQLSVAAMSTAEKLIALEERHANVWDWVDKANAILIEANAALGDQQEYVDKYKDLLAFRAPLPEN